MKILMDIGRYNNNKEFVFFFPRVKNPSNKYMIKKIQIRNVSLYKMEKYGWSLNILRINN